MSSVQKVLVVGGVTSMVYIVLGATAVLKNIEVFYPLLTAGIVIGLLSGLTNIAILIYKEIPFFHKKEVGGKIL